jgi:hypothetical protein
MPEPETVADALADVHSRYCPHTPSGVSPQWAGKVLHDPVCRILHDALGHDLEVYAHA